MRKILLALLLLLTGLTLVNSTECRDCHLCDNPTQTDPCLIDCSRDLHVPDWHDMETLHSPDVVILDRLVDLYEAVTFDHKAHAEMSGMGGNTCRLCHHENVSHEIQCCCDCHPDEGVEGAEDLIDLKVAYHRQCMTCHQDWSGEADCEICHLPLDSNGVAIGEHIIPEHTPHREAREIMNFLTDHEPAPYVTFNHGSHANEYDISCNDCHILDDCNSCHLGTQAEVSLELHDFSNRSTCEECHGTSHCGSCHSQEENRVFKHDYTGFVLKSFHADLACHACHGEQHAHGQLARDCQGCHTEGWATPTASIMRT